MEEKILLGVLLRSIVGQQDVLLVNWSIQNSQKVTATAKQISTAGFDDSSWYTASIPANGTVMAVLLQHNVYQNITYGVNLLNVNGAQFDYPWWYRTEFPVTKSDITTITFKGINYKANLYINGVQISNITTFVGTFRYFTFDISKYVTYGSQNAIALEIYRPYNEIEDSSNITGLDLAITFVDWSPPATDGNILD